MALPMTTPTEQRRPSVGAGAAAACGLLGAVWLCCGAGGAFLTAPPSSPPASLSLRHGSAASAPDRLRGSAAGAGASAVAGAALLALGAAAAAAAARGARRGGRREARPAVLCRAGADKIKLSDIKVGDKFDGTVTRIANIGIWVEIGAEKEALLPKVNLPADQRFNAGDVIPNLTVMEVEAGDTPATRKIRVSQGDRKMIGDFKPGQEVEGTVKRVMTFGVFFDVGATTDALAPQRMLEKPMEEYAVGEKATLQVVSVEDGKLTVSANKAGAGAAPKPPPNMAGTALTSLKPGMEVKGKVKSILAGKGLFVDIGAQRDALCRANQLPKDLKEYSVGDDVPDLKVLNVDAEKGQVEVTPRRLAGSVQAGDKIEGTVASVQDYGVFFDAGLSNDVLAPARGLTKDVKEYTKGEVADLIVTNVTGEKVTVSTKSAAEVGTPLSKLVRGALTSGTVKGSQAGVGLFIDIGASEDALLRVKGLPKAVSEYAVGEEIQGLIIVRVDADAGSVEVGLKDGPVVVQGRPITDFKAGDKVNGKVTRSADFGVFVDIGAERDALWPADQLAPKKPSEYLPGQEVTGLTITQADYAQSRLAVSTRQGPASYKVGDPVTGKVAKIMKFGIFIDIGASTQPLAPLRFLAKEPTDYTQGEELTDLKVISIDVAQNKMTVGQLEAPRGDAGRMDMKVSIESLAPGMQIKGIVRFAKDYGIFVDIGLGRKDALLPMSMLGNMKSDDFEKDTEIEVYVANVDANSERVTLSMTEPPAGGTGKSRRGATVSSSSSGYVPPGDMRPDVEYWKRCCGMLPEDKGLIDDEPLPWEEWGVKYPGIHKPAVREVELIAPYKGTYFSGQFQASSAGVAYIPIPVHLRRADASPPEVPANDVEDHQMGYEYGGISPYIHIKYRQPPLNDPNWVWDPRFSPNAQRVMGIGSGMNS